MLSDTFEDDSHLQPSSRSSQLALQCPACNAETFLGDQFCQECGSTQPAFENKSRITFDAIKTFLTSKKKGLIAVCALLLGIWPVTAIVSAITLPDQLDKTISQNRLNDATGLAERLFVSRFGTLSGRDAELYSEAFYRRAQVFAKNRNFKLALVDLTKVLPSYSKSSEVSQLKASYLLFLSQGKSALETATMQVESKAMTPLAPNTTAPLAPNTTALRETRSVSQQTNSANVSLQAATRMPANAQPQALGTQTATSVAAGTAGTVESADAPADVANLDKVEVNSEEADMAAYNRRLAEYFSHAESKNLKRSNKPKGSSVKEPPSFSEWVQSGKAEF